MNQPHLTCVIPAWWPAMGTSQYLLGELARYFRTVTLPVSKHDRSHPAWKLDIVTSLLPDHHSTGFDLDGCQTVRVGSQYGFPWRRKSFSHSAVRAIARRTNSPGAILLFDMNDQVAEFRSGQFSSSGLIVRYDSTLESGSLAWTFSQRRVARSLALADEIWTANYMQLESLQSLGLPAGRIRLVPDCVMPVDVDLPGAAGRGEICARHTARKSLWSVYDGLKNAMDDPLVVCALPTSLPNAMSGLIITWQHVVREMPKAILWIVGESSRSRDVMDLVQQLDMDGNVCFPGTFDSLDEVFLAANMLIHPAKTDEFAVSLLTGMRTGRSALAIRSESPAERWLKDEMNIFLLDEFVPSIVAGRIVNLLRQQETLDLVGQQARQEVSLLRNPRIFADALDRFRTGASSPDPFGAGL